MGGGTIYYYEVIPVFAILGSLNVQLQYQPPRVGLSCIHGRVSGVPDKA